MQQNAIKTSIDAGVSVATVTLSKPDIGNKLTGGEIADLAASIRRASADPKIRLIVVRSEGESFCLGRIPDPKPATPPTALDLRISVSTTIMELYASVREAPIPVLAVVQGEARGFGCALVGQCDLVVASSRAVFSLPELDTNIPPTLAISALLHKIPPKIIAHLVYTRTPISAAEARQFGLIGQIAEPETLNAASERIIEGLIDRPRAALTTVKQYLWSALYTDAAASARLAENMISVAMSSMQSP